MTTSKHSTNWNKRMTLERRCHWCGKPSAPDFANACEEHKEIAKKTNKESYLRVKNQRIKNHICLVCGKRPARTNLKTCAVCSTRNTIRTRNYMDCKSQPVYDMIVDFNYIDMDEAVNILKVCSNTVYKAIRDKKLIVRCHYERKCYFSLKDINNLKLQRYLDSIPNVRCNECGYEFHSKIKNKNVHQCSKCRNYNCSNITLLSQTSCASDQKCKDHTQPESCTQMLNQ